MRTCKNTLIASLLLSLFAGHSTYAEDSAARIIEQQYHSFPVLPLTPDQAFIVSTFDSARQKIFAEVQVRYADHCLRTLKIVNLPSNELLVQNLTGRRAEWQVILHRYEEAERILVEKRERENKKRLQQLNRELYYSEMELLIAKMRVAGGDEEADRWERELQQTKILDQLKSKR